MFEQIFEEPWEDTSGLGVDIVEDIVEDSQNGVGFSGAGLAVSEDGAVVALGYKAQILRGFGGLPGCRGFGRAKTGRCLHRL